MNNPKPFVKRFDHKDGWAALVINQVVASAPSFKVLGYVFIIDRTKTSPLWKLAAGHKEAGETPLQTAMRENQGETGLRLPAEAYLELPHCHKWNPRGDGHWSLLFKATMSQDDTRLIHPFDVGNEGEEAKYFTLAETYALIKSGQFLPLHLEKIRAAGCPLQ